MIKFFKLPLLFCQAILLCSICYSEELTVCGLKFPIENTKRMTDGTVKVSMAGTAKLITPSELNNYVVTESFKNKDFKKLTTTKSLIDFLSCSIEQGENEWSILSLSSLIGASQTTYEEYSVALSKIGNESKLLQEALLALHEENIKPEFLADSLVKIGTSDLPWIRTYGARWAFHGGAELRNALLDKFMSSLTTLNNENKVSIPADVLENLYGSDDLLVVRTKSVLSKVKSIQSALRGEDLSSVLSLLSSVDNDPEVSAMLEPVILETIHKEARNLLDKNRTADALLVLSRLSVDKRTPTTHELVREALEKLSISEINAIDHAGISEMLKFLCEKDKVIEKVWISKLSAGIQFFINSSENGNATRLVERLATIPSISTEIVDKLRLEVASAYYASGDSEKGSEVLISMTRAPSFLERISLYSSRLSRVALLIIVLLLIAGAAIGFSPSKFSNFVERMKERVSLKNDRDKEEDEDDSPPELPRFVSLSTQGKYDPRLEEYSSLLDLFGLKLGVTEKQIKVAYRLKMKEVHPDLKGEQNQAADAEFIAFRGKYERLLELHRSRKARLGEDPE